MKFEQGIFYTFKILGMIDVPEKGVHYVLLHESGRKMLLKREYYVKYNYAIGQTIECKVDKVNCAGEVFLEPRHPVYNEGFLYQFKQLSIKENADKSHNLLVKDSLDNEIDVFLLSNQRLSTSNSDTVSLIVEKIKKGRPVLTFPIAQEIPNNSNIFESIALRVVAVVSKNSEDYYSLEDSSGRIFSRLKVKHYKHYGLKVGSNCNCMVIGCNSNGLTLIEPENPWYKIGESYLFKISSIENYLNLEGEEVKSAIVLDEANNKCGLTLGVEELKQIENQSEVRAKVIGFRKGRPQLEIDL